LRNDRQRTTVAQLDISGVTSSW